MHNDYSFNLHNIYAEISILIQKIRHDLIFQTIHKFTKNIFEESILIPQNSLTFPPNSLSLSQNSQESSSIIESSNLQDNISNNEASITFIEKLPESLESPNLLLNNSSHYNSTKNLIELINLDPSLKEELGIPEDYSNSQLEDILPILNYSSSYINNLLLRSLANKISS